MKQQILRQFVRLKTSAWWPVLTALLLSVLLIHLMKWNNIWAIYPPGLCLMLPVILCAMVGGWWSGVTAIITALIIVDRELLADLAQIWDTKGRITYAGWVSGFALLGLLVSWLAELGHRLNRRARAHRRAYLSILSNIGDAVVVTDAVGHIEYLNPAACEMVGCQAKAAIGRSFESVFVIRDAQGAVQPPFGTVHLPKTARIDDTQYLKHADGRHICLETTIMPVRDGRGNLRNLVLTLRDCTDRQRVQQETEARIAAQVRLERLVAALDAMVAEVRAVPGLPGQVGKPELTYISDGYRKLLGITLEELKSYPSLWLDFCHPDDRAEVHQKISDAESVDGPVQMQYRIILPQRGVRWLLARAITETQADGTVLWRGIVMDITEQKEVEQRLAESRLQLQAALSSGHMGVLRIELESGVVTMDQGARELWDLTDAPEPLHITELWARLHPETVHEAVRQYWLMGSGEQLFSNEYQLLTRAREERLLACRGRVYRDLNGKLIKEGIISNKTHESRIERLRLHSQKMEALGVMAGGIAHDFNNLLLVMAGNTKLLRAELSNDVAVTASLAEIDKACQRATELVRRILTFSRVEQQATPLLPTDMQAVLEEILQLTRTALPAKIRIDVKLEQRLPFVEADASQVIQAVLNLMTNAADAMPEGGVVEFSAQHQVLSDAQALLLELRPGSYVCVCIADHGSGIAPLYLGRIFDPFFTTKPAGRGTGLGLAIVHGVMKAHRGAVTVINRPAGGAEFCLYFSALTPAHQAQQPVVSPLMHMPANDAAATILYVDDEEALVFLIHRTLKRMGHHVVGCSTPEQALVCYQEQPHGFDLVVSDMSMPGMTGIILAERILAINPVQPFIITTGFVHAQETEQALQLGVRQVILKPNTVDELSAVIVQVLAERKNSPLPPRHSAIRC